MAITTDSLIRNLFPGPAALPGQLPAKSPTATAEPGVVFSRSEPWRNQAGSSTGAGYTRKDAMSQGSSAPTSPSDNAPQPEQPTATDTTAADSPASKKKQPAPDSLKKPNGDFLSKAEMALLRELQKADQAVKAHEMAHLAAAGGYAKGGGLLQLPAGPGRTELRHRGRGPGRYRQRGDPGGDYSEDADCPPGGPGPG